MGSSLAERKLLALPCPASCHLAAWAFVVGHSSRSQELVGAAAHRIQSEQKVKLALPHLQVIEPWGSRPKLVPISVLWCLALAELQPKTEASTSEEQPWSQAVGLPL